MRLNSLETMLMDSPLRWITQRFLDLPFFLADQEGGIDGAVLEIGCGNGRGVEMLLTHLGVRQVAAFDLDPAMVAKARRRARLAPGRAQLWVGDVNQMPLRDRSYGAVYDFGILHHVPDWQGAVGEVYRVLQPGGRFYLFDVLAAFVQHPLWRRLMEHPQENRFEAAQMQACLLQTGFVLRKRRDLLNQFTWMVAEKPADS